MDKNKISVIICTHNPREDYLRRMLAALRQQTLSNDWWELVFVDNASREFLSAKWDLSWHPHARHIREDEPGLTPARLTGIRESCGDVLVFVDDDNILEKHYLERTRTIGQNRRYLGAWGGSTIAEYETPPPEWFSGFESYIGIRKFDKDAWSNLCYHLPTTPIGAGMTVRSDVANHYAKAIALDPIRRSLGRNGSGLGGSEDIDLAGCAIDLEYGTGVFADLQLLHLIPSSRLTLDYMTRLCEGSAFSNVLVHAVRNMTQQRMKPGKAAVIFEAYRMARMSKERRRLLKAYKRGHEKGLSEVERIKR